MPAVDPKTVAAQITAIIVAAIIGGLITYWASGQQELDATIRANERQTTMNAAAINQIQRDLAASTEARRDLARAVEELTKVVTDLRIVVTSLKAVVDQRRPGG